MVRRIPELSPHDHLMGWLEEAFKVEVESLNQRQAIIQQSLAIKLEEIGWHAGHNEEMGVEDVFDNPLNIPGCVGSDNIFLTKDRPSFVGVNVRRLSKTKVNGTVSSEPLRKTGETSQDKTHSQLEEMPVAKQQTRPAQPCPKTPDGLAPALYTSPSGKSLTQPKSLFDSSTKSIVDGEDNPIRRMVLNPIFEGVFAALIMANTIVMAFEAQWKGLDTGNKVGYFGYDVRVDDVWMGARTAWMVLEFFFGIVFSVELILKLAGLRKDFFYDYWNYLDSFIVLAWLVDTIISYSMSNSSFQLPNMMFIRLLRLVRLLRLLRLVKRIQAFDSLYLMTTAMMGSMSVLAWTVVMLVLVQMIVAMVLQQFCQPFIIDQANSIEARQQVFLYYGSFARSMLTMFELTLGNWMPPCRALVENISEWYLLIILAHKLIIGFSCVGVITGVFIQETFKVATTDDKIMLMQKERAVRTHTKKMKTLFKYADTDGSGELDREEWMAVVQQGEVKNWLGAMELDVRDADNIFTLIDDGDESMTAEELVKGVGRLKGAARSIDVCTMLHEFRKQNSLLLEFYKSAKEASAS